MLLNYSLTQLRYAVAVTDSGSFGAAARVCRVSQPTLSVQIQKLEDVLGIEMFDRDRHPIRPTAVGAEVVAQARVTLAEAERVRRIVDAAADPAAGAVRMGIIPTVAPHLVPLFLPRLLRQVPGLSLSVEERPGPEIVEGIRRGSLDFGILSGPTDLALFAEELLYFEPFVAYVPSGHRLSQGHTVRVEDLRVEDLLIVNESECFRNQTLRLLPRNGKAPARLRLPMGGCDTVRSLAQQGLGMTLLPYMATLRLDAREAALLRPLRSPVPVRQIVLVCWHTQVRKDTGKDIRRAIRAVVPPPLLQRKGGDVISMAPLDADA